MELQPNPGASERGPYHNGGPQQGRHLRFLGTSMEQGPEHTVCGPPPQAGSDAIPSRRQTCGTGTLPGSSWACNKAGLWLQFIVYLHSDGAIMRRNDS